MKINKYDWFVLAGLTLWVIETWFFGWNEEAGSVQESMADGVAMVLVVYGAICGMASSMKSEIHINGAVEIK